MSKAFDKVWYVGLTCKLKQSGVKGNLLDTWTTFLNNKKQRVALNGPHSTQANVNAGVLQSSTLEPLLF